MGKDYGGHDQLVYRDVDQRVHTQAELRHYGRRGMKWYQHIFGDDPRWGINGRAKNAIRSAGAVADTPYGRYDTDELYDRSKWSVDKELSRLYYWAKEDEKYPLSKLKKSSDKLSNPPTLDQVKSLVKKVNPHVKDPDAVEKGYKNNCVKCAVDTVLRLKGYDAEAYPMENQQGHPSFPGQEWHPYMVAFKGQTTLEYTKPVKFQLSKNPNMVPEKIMRQYTEVAEALGRELRDGDYGVISCSSPQGFGHAANFIKINGKMYGVDGQVGLVTELDDYFRGIGWIINDYHFLICTDAEINEHGVGRYVDKSKFKK